MKTRADEIEEYYKITSLRLANKSISLRQALVSMAEWADQNPIPNKYSESEQVINDTARIQILALEKEIERLSAKLAIPDEEIEEWINELDYYASPSSFEKGVIRALEYLNAQRKGGG